MKRRNKTINTKIKEKGKIYNAVCINVNFNIN